jgi:mRNA interferase HicA
MLRTQQNCYISLSVNSDQARRFLARQGCTFESGKGGHLLVRRGERTSTLPQHGGRKQLGKGLWSKILKDLGLKENR